MPIAPAHHASTLRVVIFRSVESEIKIDFRVSLTVLNLKQCFKQKQNLSVLAQCFSLFPSYTFRVKEEFVNQKVKIEK